MSGRSSYHIRCDMEGVSGVVSMEQVTPGSPWYGETREWFMAELLALVEGLRSGGADRISIYDEHWAGRNVDIARIPRGVTVFCGKPPYRTDWAGGLDASYSGMILHGLHSMAGSGELLAHTYEWDIRELHLNGLLIGEIGMETSIAGDWGVPLAMVVADSAGAGEALALRPGVATVATKVSQSPDGAECRPLPDVLEEIRSAAAHLAQHGPATEPLRIAEPATLECRLWPGRYTESLRSVIPGAFVDSERIVLHGPTATDVWSQYWRHKLEANRRIS